jgi:Ca-activated chloride channel family protein
VTIAVKTLACCAAGATGAFLAAAPRGQTFRSGVEVVRVDVLVTESGRPLSGLSAGDFALRDNGIVQQIDLARLEQLPLNVVLALDTSASVAGDRLQHLRDAAGRLLAAMQPPDRAGLVTFSHVVSQPLGLTTDTDKVRAALAAEPPPGDTSLIDGAFAGLDLARSEDGRGLLLVFSDGLDTASWLAADVVLDTARRANVVVYGASAGQTTAPFLNDLAAATGGSVLRTTSSAKLEAAFVEILQEFRLRYLLTYTPHGVETPGWHRLDVRVKARAATVKARPGYLR